MTKNEHLRPWRPKGSYPPPDGTYALDRVGKPDKDDRRIRVTAKLNPEPDLKRLAIAIVEHAEQMSMSSSHDHREARNGNGQVRERLPTE